MSQNTLTMRVSGDAWQGAPQFTVTVDGHQIGGTFTTSASHASGVWQDIAVTGDFADDPSSVAINFLNDGYGGWGLDRNLYVQSLTVGGTTFSAADASDTGGSTNSGEAQLLTQGAVTFNTSSLSAPSGSATPIDYGLQLLGVNLAGAEFGSGKTPGTYGTDYTYPTNQEVDYYAAKGLDVIRVPFLWERMQTSLNGSLDTAELARLKSVVDYATSKNLKVVLDAHDYGSYHGNTIGSAAVPNSAFADFWGKLSGAFASNSNVIYGLMNEPNQQSATQWIGSVNAAIASIRHAGAAQEILVPGTSWDGAWTWTSSGNAAVVGTGVNDPLKNYAFEVHQYLDANGSGTSAGVSADTIGVDRLTAVTNWAETNGAKLFLGEFGVSADSQSLSALNKMLTYMGQHADAWQGGTYWAGGPWWWGSNIYGIEPDGLGTSQVQDQPQMAILQSHESQQGSAPGGNGVAGPTITPAASIGSLEAGQRELIGTVRPGTGGDTLSLKQTAGTGSLALGAVQADGSYQVFATAPAAVDQAGTNVVGYTVTDVQNGKTARGSASIMLDPGPRLSLSTPTKVGHGQTVTIATVSKGLATDSLKLASASAGAGSLALRGTSVTYTAPQTVTANQTAHFSYTIQDQHGAASAAASGSVLLDPGPTTVAATITVGHDRLSDLTSALAGSVKPGLSGDTIHFVSAGAAKGKGAVTNGAATYTSLSSGQDSLTYTVSDQLGETASGRASILVDPGPVAGSVNKSVKLGSSTDLTASILAAAKAGIQGDTLSIKTFSTSGTLGTVSQVGGALVYSATGSALAALPAGSTASDSFGYTIKDQYGDVATGTVGLTISNPAGIVASGGAAPAPVAASPASPSTTTLSYTGYGNVVTLGNSSYEVNAGSGSAQVTLGDGQDRVVVAGYSNRVTIGNGDDTITGGLGRNSFVLGNGTNTVSTTGYWNQITVGSGANRVAAGSGSDTVTAGAGTSTIDLAGYGNTVVAHGGSSTISGAQGNDTYTVDAGHAAIATSGWNEHVLLLQGASADINDAGHGLKLDMGSPAGRTTITGFGADGSGIVDLIGGQHFSSVTDVMNALHTDDHGGTMLALDGGSIDFIGVPQSALPATNFHIA